MNHCTNKPYKMQQSRWRPVLLIVLAGWWVVATHAQTVPLPAPLIALNTPTHDAIVLYDVRYEGVRRLSWGASEHTVWGFSADGCRLLVTLGEKPYTVRLNGEDLRPLLTVENLPASAWGVYEPQWSPDGERIAFTFWRDQNNTRTHHIAVVSATGGVPSVYSQVGREFTPRWSPDGQWLAYVSYQERVAGADPFSTAIPTEPPPPNTVATAPTLLNEADLWLVRADNSDRFPLTRFLTGNVTAPRWSSDGTLIAFTYSPLPFSDLVWMIAAQDGAIPTQLSRSYALLLDMVWMPDGAHLVMSARNWQGNAENRLWRVPLVGIADTDATPYLPEQALTHADYPRFSADGQYVAVRTGYALAIVDTKTNTQKMLPAWADGNTPALWSPPAFTGEGACD